MNRTALAAASFAFALGIALPTWAASSINTTQPANGVPYSPAPIRLNFGAAANDINALQSKNLGTTPPSNPSPTAWWADNSGVTLYNLKIWSGRGNAWLSTGVLDTINNIWMPPIGGGIPPTLLSASTTDLGSVPQAALYISGNNSIQAFGSSAPIGAVKMIVFTGAATLVNQAGVLTTPGGSDVTQAPGDTAIVLQVSQNNWQVITDSRSQGPITPRTILSSTGNLYVSDTSGSDATNCTNNLAPCKTIQHACNVAATQFDFAGQNLVINVASGTYSAGCNMAGTLVGTATANPSPSPEFPINGLQIVGNGNPIIADTSSSSFLPAVFSAAAGAQFTVSGFTVSSTNGYGIIAQSQSLINVNGGMVFGNCGAAHISANSNGVVFIQGNYTIAGNADVHIQATTGGLVQLGHQPIPTQVTLTGNPTFGTSFINSQVGSKVNINSGTVTFLGSATGRQYIAADTSIVSTASLVALNYIPGSILGLIGPQADYVPLPPITTYTIATGLGVGGFAANNSTLNAFSYVGAIQLNTGTSGTANSGEVQFQQTTSQNRVCNATLGSQWPSTSTIVVNNAADQTHTDFLWFTNGAALNTSSQYHINYTCIGKGSS